MFLSLRACVTYVLFFNNYIVKEDRRGNGEHVRHALNSPMAVIFDSGDPCIRP